MKTFINLMSTLKYLLIIALYLTESPHFIQTALFFIALDVTALERERQLAEQENK